MNSFLTELKRRNVLRVAAAYGLVAWIIIEAGSVLLPTFGAPDWAFRIYVIVVLCGFVLSLIFAWVFELTPEGVKRDRDVDRSVAITEASPERKNFAIIALLVIALTVSITFNVTGIRNSSETAEVAETRQSIAILPFQNLSQDPANAIFADGIHDDLLTKLANNQALRVISSASVMQYRNAARNLRQIGRELGVDTILEGSVQRLGDSVRINMQLVDARTDEHLWAKTYDRKLTVADVFAIQSDISAAVSLELRAALSAEDATENARIPTDNLIAYNRYNEARSDMARRQLSFALEARRKFAEAVELDPNFAEAHAGLATSTLLLYINDQALPPEQAFRETEAALDKALALNPNLADAYATRGLLKMTIWNQRRIGNELAEAELAFEQALTLNPNHASAYMWYASLKESQGLVNQAILYYEKSIEVDPLGRIPYTNLPGLYAEQGQNLKALKHWIKATELHPDWPTPYSHIAIHLNSLGRIDEALAWYYYSTELSESPQEGGNLSIGIYMEFGDLDRAREIVLALPDENPLADFREAMAALIDAQPEEAMQQMIDALDRQPDRPSFVYDIISNIALLSGDLETAKRYALMYNPVLASDAEMVVDKYTIRSIVQLAYIEKQQGNSARAYELLNRALPVVQNRPRLGMSGHGILDVEIYALLGRDEDALSALREAIDEGFRTTITFSFWPLDHDPYLQHLRDDQRFIQMRSEIAEDIERMHENATRAEDSGDWAPLREIAIREASGELHARTTERT